MRPATPQDRQGQQHDDDDNHADDQDIHQRCQSGGRVSGDSTINSDGIGPGGSSTAQDPGSPTGAPPLARVAGEGRDQVKKRGRAEGLRHEG